MKRDEALTPLSHDHHQALFRALQLKRCEADDAAAAVAGMIEFFDDHGSRHFRVEEDVLLPGYVRHGGVDSDDEAIARVLTDHVWIRAKVEELRAADRISVDAAHELGERLDEHVRHEERVLFPAIEAALSSEQLAQLGRAVAAAEGGTA